MLAMGSGFWFFIRKYIHRVDTVEKKQSEHSVKIAVIESKVDDMRDDIKEIKHNVERLVDRKL
jgi:hypothetical protein